MNQLTTQEIKEIITAPAPFALLVIGTRVHFVQDRRTIYLGFVVGNADQHLGKCDLAVFNTHTHRIDWLAGVPYGDPQPPIPRTWHWISDG